MRLDVRLALLFAALPLTPVMFKVNKQPPEVLAILINPVVFGFDVLLLQEPDDLLFELPRPFAGNDLYRVDLSLNGLIDDIAQGSVNLVASVVNVMKVKYQLRHIPIVPWSMSCRYEDKAKPVQVK